MIDRLPPDMFGLIGEHLSAREVIAVVATCHGIGACSGECIGGRVRRHWSCVFGDTATFSESHVISGMGLVDLARLEAWIQAPTGDCVCCLRNIPLKLGAQCIECVGTAEDAFIRGNSTARRTSVKCKSSHDDVIFTCVLCDCSTCLMCMCSDDSCSMCRCHLNLA